MKIMVVEDDYLQADWIQQKLELEIPGSKVKTISTECQFRDYFNIIISDPPDVIVMDVMMRWTDPDPEMRPAPHEVVQGLFFRAGLRCIKLLAEDQRTNKIPVILYTILGKNDLEDEPIDHQDFFHLPKDASMQSLIRRIQEIRDRKLP